MSIISLSSSSTTTIGPITYSNSAYTKAPIITIYTNSWSFPNYAIHIPTAAWVWAYMGLNNYKIVNLNSYMFTTEIICPATDKEVEDWLKNEEVPIKIVFKHFLNNEKQEKVSIDETLYGWNFGC